MAIQRLGGRGEYLTITIAQGADKGVHDAFVSTPMPAFGANPQDLAVAREVIVDLQLAASLVPQKRGAPAVDAEGSTLDVRGALHRQRGGESAGKAHEHHLVVDNVVVGSVHTPAVRPGYQGPS